MRKKFLGIVLAFTMCFSTLAPSNAMAGTKEESTTPSYTIEHEEHGTTSFDDITYKRPDYDALKSEINKITKMIGKKNQYHNIVKQLEHLDKAILEASTMETYLSIQYSKDVTDTSLLDEQNLLTKENSNITKLYCNLYIKLFKSQYGNKIKKLLTKEQIENIYKTHKTLTDEFISLQTEINSLCSDYELALNTTAIDVNGTKMTLTDFQSNTNLSADDFSKYYSKLVNSINSKVGETYLKLVADYKAQAKLCGFDSAADYMYDQFERDYTKEDAAKFSDYVKKEIVPLYLTLSSSLSKEDRDKINATSGSIEPFQAKLKKYFASINPTMLDAYNYLTKYNLCDFNATPTKEQLSYTTYLSSLNEPYISLYPYGDYDDIAGFVHEFGHFYAAYMHGNYLGNCLDIDEIHSLTDELLFLPNYKSFGDAYVPIEKNVILTLLSNIVEGCLQDEFQQKVYAGNYTNVEDLNKLYFDLQCEYGLLDHSMGTKDPQWMFITHTFETPFYYISYATSAVPSLEIYIQSLTDRKTAIKTYNKVIQLSSDYNFGDLLMYAHLRSPFSDYTLSELADHLYDEFNLQAPDTKEAPAA